MCRTGAVVAVAARLLGGENRRCRLSVSREGGALPNSDSPGSNGSPAEVEVLNREVR